MKKEKLTVFVNNLFDHLNNNKKTTIGEAADMLSDFLQQENSHTHERVANFLWEYRDGFTEANTIAMDLIYECFYPKLDENLQTEMEKWQANRITELEVELATYKDSYPDASLSIDSLKKAVKQYEEEIFSLKEKLVRMPKFLPNDYVYAVMEDGKIHKIQLNTMSRSGHTGVYFYTYYCQGSSKDKQIPESFLGKTADECRALIPVVEK